MNVSQLLLAILIALSFSGYNICMKIGFSQSSAVGLLIVQGAMFLSTFIFMIGSNSLSFAFPSQWVILAFLGAGLFSALGEFGYSYLLSTPINIGLASSIVTGGIVIGTILLGMLFLEEHFTQNQFLGVFCIVLGLACLTTK